MKLSRQQWMVGIIVVMAAFLMIELLLLEPIRGELQEGEARITGLEQEYAKAQNLLRLKDRVLQEWTDVRAILSRGGGNGPQQALLEQLDGIEKRAKVNMDVEMKPENELGDFRETALDISLDTDIRGFRDLLWELGRSPEYLRMARLTVSARPFSRKNSDKLSLDFRVSTIRHRSDDDRGHSKRRNGEEPSGTSVPGNGSAIAGKKPEKGKKTDYDLIIERNIFAPPRPKAPKPTTAAPGKPVPVPKPAPRLPEWKITGIFFREAGERYRLIVEHAEKGSRVVGDGEMVGDIRIVRVEKRRVWVENDEEGWSLQVGGRFGEPGSERAASVSPEKAGSDSSSEAAPAGRVKLEEARRKELLEQLRNRRNRN